jgi:hypothetical protein
VLLRFLSPDDVLLGLCRVHTLCRCLCYTVTLSLVTTPYNTGGYIQYFLYCTAPCIGSVIIRNVSSNCLVFDRVTQSIHRYIVLTRSLHYLIASLFTLYVPRQQLPFTPPRLLLPISIYTSHLLLHLVVVINVRTLVCKGRAFQAVFTLLLVVCSHVPTTTTCILSQYLSTRTYNMLTDP